MIRYLEDYEMPHEKPTFTRDECIKRIHHGGAQYQLTETLSFCLGCQTEVTKEDVEQRIKAFGGPGHWLGCTLDKDHEGDCLV